MRYYTDSPEEMGHTVDLNNAEFMFSLYQMHELLRSGEMIIEFTGMHDLEGDPN
jgi:hypothetical protein